MAGPRLRHRRKLCDAALDALTHLDVDLGNEVLRQDQLRARAELDHPVALPAGQAVSGADTTDDATRELSGDLPDADRPPAVEPQRE